MRRYICFIIALIITDQLIKLIITRCFVDNQFDIIPTFLFFKPHLNDYPFWLEIFGISNPPNFYLAVSAILILVMWCFSVRYLTYILSFFSKCKRLLKICSFTTTSGAFCGFIDIAFWNGSWDYIGVYRTYTYPDYSWWVIFDLKDIYINVGGIAGLLTAIIFAYHYCKHYYKISDKKERKTFDKSLGIPYWIKSGFPLQYKNSVL